MIHKHIIVQTFPKPFNVCWHKSQAILAQKIQIVVALRQIKREEVLLLVAVRRSKTPELKLNFIRGNENITHSAESEFSGRNSFLGGNFLFKISE